MKQQFISTFLALALITLIHSSAFAQTPPTISYQGELQNNGVAMNGTDTLKIMIYTGETGGSPLYSETQVVSVVSGIFNVAIGSVTPLLPTLDFTKQYYLAVSVNGGTELSPRSEVSFAPYAFRALNADTSSYATNAANAALAARATIANGLSGPFVTSVNGLSTTLTLTGTNGITIANSNGNIAIGNSGVQSVNTAGGKLTLVGAGGTTITDTGTTITIHSQTFTGGTGIQAVQNSDSSITIANGSGPIATVSLGHQNASSGQVLSWNGTAWKPATPTNIAVLNTDSTITITNPNGPNITIGLAKQNATSGQVLVWNGSEWRPATVTGVGPDSIKNLGDARDDGSSVYLGAGSGVSNSGKNSNTGVGIESFHSNTSGSDNSGFGDSSLFANTIGYQNVAIGTSSLAKNTTGHSNIAIGYQSMKSNTTGYGNLAIGNQALNSNDNTSGEIAIGSNALFSDTAGGYNVAIGNEALDHNSNGIGNVAIGEGNLYENTTGFFNVAIGFSILNNNTIGSYNVAIGHFALGLNHVDSFLVAVGDSALLNDGWSFTQNNVATLDSGTANTAVGSKALAMNSVGAYNTGMGYHVLFSNSAGYRNTALGYLALNQNATGNDNTAIGSSAGPNTTNLNNTTTLGSGAVATTSNEVVIGNPNVTSLYCAGAYAATTANAANMVVTSTGQIMRSTSSARYKTDIHDLDINTDKLYDLRPVSYISKIDGKPYFGLVAEDVAKVIPDLAEYARAKDVIPGSTSDELIPDAVKYPMLSVLLLEELKKEHAKEESQEKIIADLAKRVEALETEQNGRTH